MAARPHRLIIGLDYGTTFTGITYGVVTTRDGEEMENFIYSEWPRRVGEKVPSEISYSSAPGNERQWGFDIAVDSLKLVWTKLELEQQERHDELRLILNALDGMRDLDPRAIREAGGLPSYPARDPVDIVAEYLSKVREYVRDHPPNDFPTRYLLHMSTDLVVTVPAGWSDRAKDRIFRAIDQAGFNQQNFARLQDIILLTEPEAAALYTVKTQLEIEGPELMVPGDCFVLCDAGGGTVDLISYRVRQLRPFIQLEEVDMPTGAKCGATFIDRQFMAWLEKKLGTQDFEELVGKLPENAIGSHTVVSSSMRPIMDAFENTKRQFVCLGNPAESFIALPHPLSMEDDPARSIVGGDLRITDHDLRDMFEPVVDPIIDLIRGQIGLVLGTGSKVRYVFLTGGFGLSEYLFRNIDEFTRMRDIRTKRPGRLHEGNRREQELHCWTAVMQGAVLRGLEKGRSNPIYMRKCRRYYGVSVSEPFSSFKHLERDSYIDPFDGEKKAQGQMNWLLRKGDALLSNQSKHASIDICRKFGVHDPRVFRTNLLALDDDNAPKRYADIPTNRMTIIELVYDLSNFLPNRFKRVRAGARGTPYLCAHLKLEIRLETNLEFKVIFDGEELENVVVNYE